MKTYSDKVKFILDYVIIFGVLNEESKKYHYELSKDEKLCVDYVEESVIFYMFDEVMGTAKSSASIFTSECNEAIDLFYDSLIGLLGESKTIPEEFSDLVREATLEAYKSWDGATVIREKEKDMGRYLKMKQIPITNSCFLEVKDSVGKHLYFIRFCTSEFYDVSDQSYEHLFNKE